MTPCREAVANPVLLGHETSSLLIDRVPIDPLVSEKFVPAEHSHWEKEYSPTKERTLEEPAQFTKFNKNSNENNQKTEAILVLSPEVIALGF
mmetsp:Transcript_18242/g.23862  ORF Transcript_18242/g.23862 Transcript_18242/m.23862 type:complete len:92 (+) Transcript_18242:2-277(+)